MSATFPSVLAQAATALRQGRFKQAAQLVQPWAQPPQEQPAALQILGLAQAGLQQFDAAEATLHRLLELAPHDAAAWVNLGHVQLERGHAQAAVQSLDQALARDPQLAAAYLNHGLALMKLDQPEAAIVDFDHAARLAPNRPDPRYNQAMALHQLGRDSQAQALLDPVTSRWPGFAPGWNLLGMIRQKQRRYQEAFDAYSQALRCNPRLADAWANAAQALSHLERHTQARAAAERAVQLAPDYLPALRTLGAVLCDGDDREEEAAYPWLEKAHQIDPEDPLSLLYLIDRNVRQCDWARIDARLPVLQRLIAQGKVTALQPFRLLSLPCTLVELRDATAKSCAHEFSGLPRLGAQEGWGGAIGRPRPAKLRIGYFSADFHNHATMNLMAGFFEAHDKSRFETIGICLGHYGDQPDGPMRTRAKRALDRFETAGDLNDDQLLALARKLDLHIAVDLKGHTKDHRMGVLVQRVAPIQMHYLGYPGTLGMPGAIDYLVADRVLIPQASRPFYTEKIIELPDSYQVNDRQRAIDPVVPSRLELGLPESAFVFCCFNNSYKITREVFGLWMQLLKDKEDSVLWLLTKDDAAARNLKQAARDAGIDPSRIVFAQQAALPRHLARHARADLFLDTWPYNAHTTASDALWAGLPVLTCMGETFASRVGASLLTACNLPELITGTSQDYLARAKELAHDPQQLSAIRHKLQNTRLTVPLFDTERFTRHLEKAYDLAWARFAQGLPPDHITVPPMA
ncbi:MAG: tetratricopeptide repeat protein [Burkholderiaceae bacterium]|jgi:predicted O-linked N-acetylglucosamine transferase (SPINDLY family)|nr:tetratricopeptide repeat protein [Burkholderiaceae bacterium]